MSGGNSSSFFLFLLLCVTAIAAVFMATTTTTSNGVSATPAGPMPVQVAAGNWPTFTFNSSLEAVGGGGYKMEVDFEEEFQLDSDAYRRILAQQLQYIGETALDANRATCITKYPGDSYMKADGKYMCFRKVNTSTPIHNCGTHYYRDCYL